MKKKITVMTLILVIAVVTLGGCKAKKDLDISKYSYPDLSAEGWTETMNVDFSTIKTMDDLNAAKWFSSKHGLRNEEYWCPSAITFGDDGVVIKSEIKENHVCADGLCPASGIFTGGIETRIDKGDGTFDNVFSQAFGYFETTVRVPSGTGMWSAFWLQSDDVGRIGDKGRDGSEIDIYESSFRENPTMTGNAVHYDAYSWPWYQSHGKVTDTGLNLYEGFHSYGLLWTPDEYVFFVDGKPVWATAFGGVSRVEEILRLTVEIRTGGVGPYGQNIGQFQNRDDGSNDFIIKSVRVYQNDAYKPAVKTYENGFMQDLLGKIKIG
ncbi:MAG: glycoside hydrolase family 16 protein [Clostridiales bacterium]|jgi:hypothetical protein|nr:glycoside hydrolase family 16 protein [Clostridiales bacterium]